MNHTVFPLGESLLLAYDPSAEQGKYWAIAGAATHAVQGGAWTDSWAQFFDPGDPLRSPSMMALLQNTPGRGASALLRAKAAPNSPRRFAQIVDPDPATLRHAIQSSPTWPEALQLPPIGPRHDLTLSRQATTAPPPHLLSLLSPATKGRQSGEPLWIIDPSTLAPVGITAGRWTWRTGKLQCEEWWAFHNAVPVQQARQGQLVFLLARASRDKALEMAKQSTTFAESLRT